MKAQRGSTGIVLSLTSALDQGGWLTPRFGHFIPGKETWYMLYRGQSGPQGRSERVRKISPSPEFFCFCFFFVLSLYFACTALSWLSWLCLLSLLCNIHNTNIHALGGIRTRNPSMREAVELRLRPLGHWHPIRSPSSPVPVAIPTELCRLISYRL